MTYANWIYSNLSQPIIKSLSNDVKIIKSLHLTYAGLIQWCKNTQISPFNFHLTYAGLITVIKSLSNDVKILKSLPAKRCFVRSYYSTTPVMNLFLLCVCSQKNNVLQSVFSSCLSWSFNEKKNMCNPDDNIFSLWFYSYCRGSFRIFRINDAQSTVNTVWSGTPIVWNATVYDLLVLLFNLFTPSVLYHLNQIIYSISTPSVLHQYSITWIKLPVQT